MFATGNLIDCFADESTRYSGISINKFVSITELNSDRQTEAVALSTDLDNIIDCGIMNIKSSYCGLHCGSWKDGVISVRS